MLKAQPQITLLKTQYPVKGNERQQWGIEHCSHEKMNLNKKSRLVTNSSESMALQQYINWHTQLVWQIKKSVFLSLCTDGPIRYVLLYRFALFYFAFEAAISKYKPRDWLCSEGWFNGGFFALLMNLEVLRGLYIMKRLIFGILWYFDTVFSLFVFKQDVF